MVAAAQASRIRRQAHPGTPRSVVDQVGFANQRTSATAACQATRFSSGLAMIHTMMMRRIYVAIVGLLLASGVLQFYFAAIGAFSRPQTDDSFALHVLNGRIFALLALVAILAAALARAPGRLIGMTALTLGLTVVQTLIVVLGKVIGGSTEQRTTAVSLAILGLHALNGIAVMGVASSVLTQARAHAKAAIVPVSTMEPAR